MHPNIFVIHLTPKACDTHACSTYLFCACILHKSIPDGQVRATSMHDSASTKQQATTYFHASLGAFYGLQLVHNKAFLETGMPTIGMCIIVTQSPSMYMACQFASFWYVTSRHMYASTAVIKK